MKRGLLASVFIVSVQGLLFGAESFGVEIVPALARTLAEQSFYDAALGRLRQEVGEQTPKFPPFSSFKTNLETGKNLCRVKQHGRLVALVGINRAEDEHSFYITLYAASPMLRIDERQALLQATLQFARDDLHAAQTTVIIRKRRASTSSGATSEGSE